MDTNLVYILCTAHSGHFSMTPISVWNFQHPMPALIYWWNMLVYLALGRRFRNKQSAHKTNNEFSVYLAIIIKFMFILYVLFSVIYLLLLFLSGWMHVCYSTINWSACNIHIHITWSYGEYKKKRIRAHLTNINIVKCTSYK